MNELSIDNTSIQNLKSCKSNTLTKCKSFNNSSSQENNQYVEKLANSIMEVAIISYNLMHYFSDKKRCSSMNKTKSLQVRKGDDIIIN